MVKILIVEDEPNMRMGLRDNLEFEGYEVGIAEDGEKGLKMIRENQYNLIILDVMMPKMSGFDVCKTILDVMMPKMSGFDVCKTIRKEGVQTPVILLTAKGEEIDKVLGLELGADDYVTKPFSLRELLARVKAVLRRGETSLNTSTSEAVIGKHF
ncbi:MAG: response regulator [Ignavibacteriaceae bacterium]|nr:response regulator [Ignavibacteriaceae bacterium]